jgi:hypothetical protein
MKVINIDRKVPTPEDLKAARVAAGLTQVGAAELLGMTVTSSGRSSEIARGWQTWESGARQMPEATWAYFLLITSQHPEYKLVKKTPPMPNE